MAESVEMHMTRDHSSATLRSPFHNSLQQQSPWESNKRGEQPWSLRSRQDKISQSNRHAPGVTINIDNNAFIMARAGMHKAENISDRFIIDTNLLQATAGIGVTAAGVKNKQAQKNLKSMTLGDLCFFYHSGTKSRCVMGVVEVTREWYSDDDNGEVAEKERLMSKL